MVLLEFVEGGETRETRENARVRVHRSLIKSPSGRMHSYYCTYILRCVYVTIEFDFETNRECIHIGLPVRKFLQERPKKHGVGQGCYWQ